MHKITYYNRHQQQRIRSTNTPRATGQALLECMKEITLPVEAEKGHNMFI